MYINMLIEDYLKEIRLLIYWQLFSKF